MNIAMPIAIGTPMTMAMNEEMTVPKNTAAMPKTGGSALRVPGLGGEDVAGVAR